MCSSYTSAVLCPSAASPTESQSATSNCAMVPSRSACPELGCMPLPTEITRANPCVGSGARPLRRTVPPFLELGSQARVMLECLEVEVLRREIRAIRPHNRAQFVIHAHLGKGRR